MPFWGVAREAWEANCEEAEPTHCTTAATRSQGEHASVGEVAFGDGVVRIVGALLPNPNPVDDEIGDHRFGLGSYALTWTAYEVFENLVDWQRPGSGSQGSVLATVQFDEVELETGPGSGLPLPVGDWAWLLRWWALLSG